LLRGWVRTDGSSDSDLAAVRYMVAIERAYTRALRADAGYAGLVTHNPFAACYETHSGRDEPYSLRELAAFVDLPRMVPRRSTEIRTDGRNVETFERLRHWAYAQISEYRCGPRDTWNEVVDARALAIAAEVRAAHPAAAHPYGDAEALDTAKSVAGWEWMRYVGGSLTRVRADTAVRRESDRQRAIAARRERGEVPRDVYLAEVQRRRTAANTLRGLGVSVVEIAHRLGASIRSVHRWISEIRCVPSPSALSDFERPPRPKSSRSPSVVLSATSSEVVEVAPETPHAASERSEASTEASTEFAVRYERHDQQHADDRGEGVRGRTIGEGPMAYIRRRIAEIVTQVRARPP
jgi:transposase